MMEDSSFQTQKADTSLFPTITPEKSSEEPPAMEGRLTRTEVTSKVLHGGPKLGKHDSVSIVSGSGPLDFKQSLGIVANISPVQHRRAQNRASQRAYRERKEKRLIDLESQIRSCESEKLALIKQCAALKKRCRQLERERELATTDDQYFTPDIVSKNLDQALLKSGPSTSVNCDKPLLSNVQPGFFVPWESSLYETIMACTKLSIEGMEIAEGLP